MDYRTETDFLGSCQLPEDALYGIHTRRAMDNFPLSGQRIPDSLIHAYGAVKLACARTNHALRPWPSGQMEAIERACAEMMNGQLDDHIHVDALQGGAGTSTNMNINEVLTNRALQLLGHPPGSYSILDPLRDLNRHQSTNDTFPTALRIAAISELRILERAIVGLQESFQVKEKELADVVKIARTECQDAVLTTLGRSMSAYAEAFSRDRWRVYKCEERLRVVNLGGTAIGSGLAAPRKFIFTAIDHLRSITGMGLARAENMIDVTQNQDPLVEVSGIIRACATNLLKVSSDLRFLSSGPSAGIGELRLPPRQAGSSIMPGKINPVIPEAVTQAAITVFGYDSMLTSAAAAGHLELNPFLPLIAHALLRSIGLMTRTCRIFAEACIRDIKADRDRCRAHVENATAGITAIMEVIGYKVAESVATEAAQTGRPIREIVIRRNLMSSERFDELIAPEKVGQLGFSGERCDYDSDT